MNEFFGIVPPEMLLYMAAFFVYTLSVKRITAFSFVIVGIMFLEVLHQGISMYLQSYFKSQDKSVLRIVFHAWYLSFAATDLMFYSLTILLSRWMQVRLDMTSLAISYIYLGLGLLQLICYIDQMLFQTEFIATIYSKGIPIVNYLIFALLFAHVCASLFKKTYYQLRFI